MRTRFFNRNEALRRGRVYRQLGCYWREEPLPPHDREGLAMLAQELDLRTATGENRNPQYAFAGRIARRGADVGLPADRGAGGEWIEIAAGADAHGLERARHGGGDTNLNMLRARPNALCTGTSSAHRPVDGAGEEPGRSNEVTAAEIRRDQVG